MQFDRFSELARQACNIAGTEAMAMRAEEIDTAHLLLGVLQVELTPSATASPLADLLIERDLTVTALRDQVRALVPMSKARPSQRSLPFTEDAISALTAAGAQQEEAAAARVETHHLLLALLPADSEQFPFSSVAALAGLGVDAQALRTAVQQRLETAAANTTARPKALAGNPRSAQPENPLQTFSRDLNALAREGKLEAAVERDTELRQVMETLTRKAKNNPVLVGEPGIGKTAIVEGLAVAIEQRHRNVPARLRNKRIYALDLGAMVAGTKYRGEFEERLKNTVRQASADPDIILFIDELHTLLGAGSAEGSLDAASILKPALARGELATIGATTLDDYRRYMEGDSALERRFQKIRVEPPSVAQTVRILEGLAAGYERHHRVRIDRSALTAAAQLTDRFIADRFLPDKAIDALDAACARLAFGHHDPPEVAALEAQIHALREQADTADRSHDHRQSLSLAAQIQALEAERDRLAGGLLRGPDGEPLTLTDEIVAEVVSQWSGTPVHRLAGDELDLYRNMEQHLGRRTIGQQEAIKKVAQTLRRSRAGVADRKRPVGSLLFLGPTGVGKTELARSLAELLFGDEDAMVRLDMSEFMEKHTVSKLIGSPPGYTGYKEGGQLTEAVRHKPYCVLLLDEIEKAHEDIFNVLLQVLEDGRLTDSKGRTVSFRHAVIIMTSNLGAEHIVRGGSSLGFSHTDAATDHEQVSATVVKEAEKFFRPEFINRIDDIVVFRKLDRSELEQVLQLMAGRLVDQLSERDIALRLDPAAVDLILAHGTDDRYGARPLRRALKRLLENPLADFLLSDEGATLEGRHELVAELAANSDDEHLLQVRLAA